MTQKLIIVSGMYGTGKTTYCTTVEHPVLHIDDVYDYVKNVMHYYVIKGWKGENTQSDTIVFDAYLFGVDRDLSGLREAIVPISDISVKMIYLTLDELYICQRTTENRRALKARQNYSREEEAKQVSTEQIGLSDIFTDHLNAGRITSVEYIFREGAQYTITDKEHFLKTMVVNINGY